MSLPATINFPSITGTRDAAGASNVNNIDSTLTTWSKQPAVKAGEIVYLPLTYSGYTSFSKLVIRSVLQRGQLVVTVKLFLAPLITDSLSSTNVMNPEKSAGYYQLGIEQRVPVSWDRLLASSIIACFCGNINNPALVDTRAEVDALTALTTNMLDSLGQGIIV